VVGYRANLLVRVRLPVVTPHFAFGGGAETLTSDSPFTTTDTDPVIYFGLGASAAIAPGWVLRFDGRAGFQPARDGTTANTFQLLLGLGRSFGGHKHKHFGDDMQIFTGSLIGMHTKAPETDTDGDGIPDKLDSCPLEPETVNGIDDDDGCPELDPDGDGIVGSADKCPNQAEDFDHYQDEDGCPDPDNDGDGIPDAKDACPNDPETKNGFEDDDGCPDSIPSAVANAFAGVGSMKFEPGRVRLTNAAKKALDGPLKTLRAYPTLHIVISGHPDSSDADKNGELAKKRAEAVKWYIVEQGIAADQIDTVVGEARPKGPPISVAIAPKPSPQTSPQPARTD
jgi:OOP family OmpA-OmpF porin